MLRSSGIGLGKKKIIIWEWQDRKLVIGERALVMGILNVTPDSFSDGGRFVHPLQALERARQMVAEGAAVIDVGGESTRPGSSPVGCQEEMDRVMPVLELLLKEIPTPISLDTYKPEVAREGLRLGVHIINDVGGGKKDPRMAEVAAGEDVPVIIMHNPRNPCYQDVVSKVINDLAESIEIYGKAGLSAEKIMVDPGIGFGKDLQGNLALLRNIRAFDSLDNPLLLGASRKSFIGKLLETEPPDRLEGSLAAVAWGVTHGVAMVRVHDVKETVRLIRVLEAIQNGE